MSVAIRSNDDTKLGWYDDSTPVVRKDGTPALDDKHQPIIGKGEIVDIVITNAELSGDNTLASAFGTTDGFMFQKEWSNQDNQAEMAAGGGQ